MELRVSLRTMLLGFVGFGLLLVLAVASLAIVRTSPDVSAAPALTLMTDVAAVVFDVLAFAMVTLAAFRYRADNPLRHIWAMIAIGLGLYAIGDAVWTALDIQSSFTDVPYPSLAEAFYVVAYLFIAYGLAKTTTAFARSAHARMQLTVAVVTTLVATAVAVMAVSLPVALDPAESLAVRALAVYYPVADLALLFGPSLFIMLAAHTIKQMNSIRQWMVLSLGLLIWSVADIAFIWADQAGGYFAGHPSDFGWMLSLLTLGIAGSLAADRLDAPIVSA